TRSHMFFLSALLAFVDALASRFGTNNSSSTGCRARAGPSSTSLRAERFFSAGTTSGRCLPSGQLTYDADECATISAANGPTYVYQQDQPISGMWQQFARAHNVRVVVKSSGHDYQGRSQAPGALSIWVHHMQDMTTHTSFQPEGCNFTIDSPAVTIGGGGQIGKLYRELDRLNQTVVGGGSSSVSVGGYITGGGHSLLAPRYGLAADQVLQLDLVTPMGEILTANECQNQDLFWAMRGGGGSTFGVMTSVTLATHPTPKMVAGELGLFTPDLNATFIWDLSAYVLSQFPYLDARGVSGYSVITDNYTVPDGGSNNGSATTISLAGFGAELVLLDTQDPDDMLSVLAPIIDHANRTWPGLLITPSFRAYPSFWDWFQSHDDPSETGYDLYVGSRLLGADALTADPAAVAAAFKALGGTAYLVAGRGVQDARPRGGGNAVCPAWRKALVHATNGQSFAPLDPAARAHALEEVNARVEPLRRLAPDMGAYGNENNPGEPDWQHAFWGDNYRRLLQIKRRVDPV
ncbi:FAD-binding domain-containing protein, partial [Xylariomycetidae sp. FL2044]